MVSLRSFGVALILAASALACGDEVSVSNTSPRGTVGGIIVDASTRAPLAGVSVVLLARGELRDTDPTAEDGTFRFDDVPFGTVLVMVTPADASYIPATIRGMLVGNAGDFPVGNESLTLGPIGLVPTQTDVFRFRVLDHQGAPVANYQLAAYTAVEWVDYSGGVGTAQGERIYTVTTDGEGYAAVGGLPAYFRLGSGVSDGLAVNLPPYDAEGDGIWDFDGGVHVFSMLSLGDPTPDVILAPAYLTALSIQASTIAALEPGNVTLPVPAVIDALDGNVFMKFNLPIEPDPSIVAVNESGGAVAPPSVTVEGDTLQMRFPTLQAGAEYNLTVHAVAAVGDRIIEGDFSAPFFTRAAAPDVTIVSTSRGASTIRVKFSEPIGTGDPNANFLSGGNCVIFWNADIDGNGSIGNVSGEVGNADCSASGGFNHLEIDPVGPVGFSGYTTEWEFPIIGLPSGQAPSGTQVSFVFSHVVTPYYRIERVDGSAVEDVASFVIP